MALPRQSNLPASGTSKTSQAGDRTKRFSRMFAGFALTLAVLTACWYFFTGSKIQLSEHGYELSKALYATCNLEDTRRLEAFVKAFNEHSPSLEEQAKLRPMIELAQGGKWKDAAAQARQLLQSQDKY